jgi:hypothetical protein
LGLAFLVCTGLGVLAYLQPQPPRLDLQADQIAELPEVLLEAEGAEGWRLDHAGEAAGLAGRSLQPQVNYRLRLYGGGVSAVEAFQPAPNQLVRIVLAPAREEERPCLEEMATLDLTILRCAREPQAEDPVRPQTWRQRLGAEAGDRLWSVGLEIAYGDLQDPRLRAWHNTLLRTGSVDVLLRYRPAGPLSAEGLAMVLQALPSEFWIGRSQILWWTVGGPPADPMAARLQQEIFAGFDASLRLAGDGDLAWIAAVQPLFAPAPERLTGGMLAARLPGGQAGLGHGQVFLVRSDPPAGVAAGKPAAEPTPTPSPTIQPSGTPSPTPASPLALTLAQEIVCPGDSIVLTVVGGDGIGTGRWQATGGGTINPEVSSGLALFTAPDVPGVTVVTWTPIDAGQSQPLRRAILTRDCTGQDVVPGNENAPASQQGIAPVGTAATSLPGASSQAISTPPAPTASPSPSPSPTPRSLALGQDAELDVKIDRYCCWIDFREPLCQQRDYSFRIEISGVEKDDVQVSWEVLEGHGEIQEEERYGYVYATYRRPQEPALSEAGENVLVAVTVVAADGRTDSDRVGFRVWNCGSCGDSRIFITSPAREETVSGTIQILGTARHERFQFYKLEYAGPGTQGYTWLGDSVHRQPVTYGVLDTLDTTRLPNGAYRLRLTVVDATGNYPPQCELPITVQN